MSRSQKTHPLSSFETPYFRVRHEPEATVLRLHSRDGTNRLTRSCVIALKELVDALGEDGRPLIVTGNDRFFSAGADLSEIAALDGPSALEFSRMGQALMNAIDQFPSPVLAAVSGYCMGGGFDLALACHHRIASPRTVFGHRGAALGLVTGWGGTQRLPRLIGKAHALEMLVAAEKITASYALHIGLVDAVVEHPVEEGLLRLTR